MELIGLMQQEQRLNDMDLHLNITQDLGRGIMVIFLCCVLTATVVVIDLITGVRAAKKVGELTRNHYR